MKRFAIALALLVVACGGNETAQQTTTTAPAPARPAPPTADQAREIIAGAAEFGDFEFTNAGYSLPLQRSMMNEPQREAAQQLIAAKWLKWEGETLALSSRSEGDKRFLMRPNGTLDIVPLAKKEMGAVSAVADGPEGPVATFAWKWLPNEVGQSFTKGLLAERFAGEQSGKATLLWDGTNWSVLRITR